MPTSTHHRRGLTLLESILAVALLALVATSISSVIGAVSGSQRRAEIELAAAEVANRILIQYMDDKFTLEERNGKPIPYGPDDDTLYFRWDMRVGTARLDVSDESRLALEQSPTNIGSVDTVKQVKVWVWLGEMSGGSFALDQNTPSVAMTRLYAPIAGIGFRNPDTRQKLTEDRHIQELMTEIVVDQQGAGWNTESLQQLQGEDTSSRGRSGARGRLGRAP